jgi:1-acyl-sn-glycerol-3-phosphate acyltransferase
MLDQALLDTTRLHARPIGQRLIAHGFLRFDYRKIELVVEGASLIPARPVIYVMNHTDDFNYWPLQYHLLTQFDRYTATWVKGKNYEHPILRAFMRSTNNIPIPSRGYLITRDFMSAVGRRPTEAEYRLLRGAVDGLEATDDGLPEALIGRAREIFGRPFDPANERYVDALEAVFLRMMDRFIALNEEALAMGLDLLVFPQGTRSKRLSRGHIGLAQMALHLGATIVPVGCSGSDVIYPKRSPLTSPGRVVYRIGAPLGPDELASFAVPDGCRPFHRADEAANRERYQALVDHVMDRIDGLLDEPYRFAADARSEGTVGTARFV